MNEGSFHVVLGTGRSASPWPLISPASGVRASLRIDAVEPSLTALRSSAVTAAGDARAATETEA
jgi:hypothetical protein